MDNKEKEEVKTLTKTDNIYFTNSNFTLFAFFLAVAIFIYLAIGYTASEVDTFSNNLQGIQDNIGTIKQRLDKAIKICENFLNTKTTSIDIRDNHTKEIENFFNDLEKIIQSEEEKSIIRKIFPKVDSRKVFFEKLPIFMNELIKLRCRVSENQKSLLDSFSKIELKIVARRKLEKKIEKKKFELTENQQDLDNKERHIACLVEDIELSYEKMLIELGLRKNIIATINTTT